MSVLESQLRGLGHTFGGEESAEQKSEEAAETRENDDPNASQEFEAGLEQQDLDDEKDGHEEGRDAEANEEEEEEGEKEDEDDEKVEHEEKEQETQKENDRKEEDDDDEAGREHGLARCEGICCSEAQTSKRSSLSLLLQGGGGGRRRPPRRWGGQE